MQPQYAQEFTWFVAVTGDQQRVKLWIDNSLIVEQWTSLVGTEGSGTLSLGLAGGYYTPSSLNTILSHPRTLNPKLLTPNPKSQTLNPKS